MKSTSSSSGKKTRAIALPFLAIILTFTWLGVSADTAMAQTDSTRYSSAKDWNLKAENLSPRGHNPLYFPLKPGFKFIMERPDHPDGYYRKEVIVLDKTESFDLPGIAGIGKFECAVV